VTGPTIRAVPQTCLVCQKQVAFLSNGKCRECRALQPWRPYGTDENWVCLECGQKVDMLGNGCDPNCNAWN
jgi:hypothetical protein